MGSRAHHLLGGLGGCIASIGRRRELEVRGLYACMYVSTRACTVAM